MEGKAGIAWHFLRPWIPSFLLQQQFFSQGILALCQNNEKSEHTSIKDFLESS